MIGRSDLSLGELSPMEISTRDLIDRQLIRSPSRWSDVHRVAASAAGTPSDDDGPTWVAAARRSGQDIRLDGILRTWAPSYARSQILLIDSGVPVSWFCCAGPPPPVEQLPFPASRATSSASAPEQLPTTTIAICTRERPTSLARCIASILPLLDEVDALVVVDNAPRTPATRTLVESLQREHPKIRYARQEVRGISAARNLALTEAKTEIVIFTDDDVVADPGWIEPIRRAMAAEISIGIVLGLVPPAELESSAQRYFGRRLPWSSHLERVRLSTDQPQPYELAFPYCAGQFGAGANLAVRRDAVVALGGFNEALGVGARAGGGEDLELFVRCLRADMKIAYEPASIVWHVHSPELKALDDRVFRYGSGMSAYLAALMFTRGEWRQMLVALPQAVRYLMRTRRPGLSGPAERRLLLIEMLGLLWGPVAYLSARVARYRR